MKFHNSQSAKQLHKDEGNFCRCALQSIEGTSVHGKSLVRTPSHSHAGLVRIKISTVCLCDWCVSVHICCVHYGKLTNAQYICVEWLIWLRCICLFYATLNIPQRWRRPKWNWHPRCVRCQLNCKDVLNDTKGNQTCWEGLEMCCLE